MLLSHEWQFGLFRLHSLQYLGVHKKIPDICSLVEMPLIPLPMTDHSFFDEPITLWKIRTITGHYPFGLVWWTWQLPLQFFALNSQTTFSSRRASDIYYNPSTQTTECKELVLECPDLQKTNWSCLCCIVAIAIWHLSLPFRRKKSVSQRKFSSSANQNLLRDSSLVIIFWDWRSRGPADCHSLNRTASEKGVI